MTTDPSIILGGTNIAAEAAKQTAATQQAQAAQGQLQLQQYSIAQAKQDFEDTQNLKQAWRQAGGDPTQTMAIAGKLGVSMKGIQAFNKNQMELQGMLDTHNKTVADTGKTNLEIMNEKNENVYTKLAPLMNAKDPIEFESKKAQTIGDLKKSGLVSDDELKMLSGANQQQVQDWGTGHLNVKALTEVLNANSAQETADAHKSQAKTASDKQTNEAASQIETSNQAKLSGASTQLNNALAAGGLTAYTKVLDGMTGDELLSGSFPKAEALAVMNPAAAKKAIDDAGMTSHQREQAVLAAQQQAIANKHADEQIRNDNMRNSIERQNVALATKKYEMEFGGDAIKGWTAQIKDNPSAIEDLPPNLRNSVGQNFFKETGTPLPTKLGQADKTNLNNARFTQGMIGDLRGMVASPEIQSIMGPIAGRLAKGESIAGIGNTQAQQAFVSKLEYLFAGEGKTVFGGRAPQKLLEGLKAVSADPSKGMPEMLGAFDAANGVAQQRIDSTVGSQFGGKVPSWYTGNKSTNSTAAPAAPKVNDTNVYNGATYKFDGTQWRLSNGK